MNLEELQSIQSRERQASSLQHLRDSFYQDAGEYVQELHDRRDAAAAESDDPFGSEEVRRLSDDIETAERTVEAIYERRIGKIVKMASIAAADMPYDDDGLTAEETRLFENLVSNIEENRELVLSVLDGEAPGISCSRPDDASEPTSPEGTADHPPSAEGPETAAGGPTPTADPAPPEEFAIGDAMGSAEDGDSPPEPAAAGAAASATGANDSGTAEAGAEAASERVERATVRITADVGDIFGVDGRAYDLATEDVVTLPEENATVLTRNGQAERID